jgi:hypothetical protein
LTEKNGRLLFHARYGNCYEGVYESTTHAKYFMLMDEQFRQAVQLLQDQKEGDIDMFMNKQPSGFWSTGHGKKNRPQDKGLCKGYDKFLQPSLPTTRYKIDHPSVPVVQS